MANGTAITIDSDECIMRLTRAKFTKDQAEAVVNVLKKDVDIDTSELATKKDLEFLEERITRKMAQQQILTIATLTGVIAVMLVMQGYFLMTLK